MSTILIVLPDFGLNGAARQVSLQASLQTMGSILKLSLLDYI